MIIIVQSCVLAAEIALVVLALTDQLQPAVLLLLLVLVASGAVLTFTPVQSMVPDVVERESIPAATALLAVATNSARIIGPAVAGLIIAIASVGAAFAAALPLTVILLVLDVALERPQRAQPLSRGLHARCPQRVPFRAAFTAGAQDRPAWASGSPWG